MEREFYLRVTIKEKWSRRELERQINSSAFERVMIANQKLSPLVRESQDVTNSFKDTSLLELLHLPEMLGKRELRNQISSKTFKRAVIANSQNSITNESSQYLFKDPYFLDFFGF